MCQRPQLSLCRSAMTAILIRALLLISFCAPAEAVAAHSDWVPTNQSKLRLLLSQGPDGLFTGGIEIVLEPGWHTYWRNPGDAGVPPTFDFAGSENVAKVEVLYPAPERYDDGSNVSLVYRDEVVFPALITPIDAGKPVTLRVNATFGVCSEVCIPTNASASVTQADMTSTDPLAHARIEQFRSRLPGAAEAGEFEILNATAEGDELLINVRTPNSSYIDLFADPPAGWYVGQPAFVSRANGISRFKMSLSGRPPGAAVRGQNFGFVAVAGGDAIEQTLQIQ
jgi:DsbC/DsbD-like thiol-disulfide interchange protein